MNRLNWVACLLSLAWPACAGEVQGHAIVTKRLTKKALSPIVYNLRGAVSGPSAAAKSDAASEFDRLVVVLEGGASHAKPPETVVIDQRNMRPVLLIQLATPAAMPAWDQCELPAGRALTWRPRQRPA
jgi:hypothetical protein